jgi:hypothetical protein
VAAGVVTTIYAVTGLSAIGAAFVAVALVLALFAVGYVAIARHITNAGALYAHVSRGLGRPAGVGAALVAALADNLLQVGLYGMFGPTLSGYLADKLGWNVSWWVCALAAWLLVAVLGVLRVDLNGRVLGVLLCAEVLMLHYVTLLGVAPGSTEAWALPAAFAVVAVVGVADASPASNSSTRPAGSIHLEMDERAGPPSAVPEAGSPRLARRSLRLGIVAMLPLALLARLTTARAQDSVRDEVTLRLQVTTQHVGVAAGRADGLLRHPGRGPGAAGAAGPGRGLIVTVATYVRGTGRPRAILLLSVRLDAVQPLADTVAAVQGVDLWITDQRGKLLAAGDIELGGEPSLVVHRKVDPLGWTVFAGPAPRHRLRRPRRDPRHGAGHLPPLGVIVCCGIFLLVRLQRRQWRAEAALAVARDQARDASRLRLRPADAARGPDRGAARQRRAHPARRPSSAGLINEVLDISRIETAAWPCRWRWSTSWRSSPTPAT